MINIDPKRIVSIPVRGSGNVAVPISWHTPWVFLSLRMHFVRASGTGTDTATFTLALSDPTYTEFNWTAGTLTARGVSGDIHARIPSDELYCWLFKPEQRLVGSWTNPDPVEILFGGWALIYPVE